MHSITLPKSILVRRSPDEKKTKQETVSGKEGCYHPTMTSASITTEANAPHADEPETRSPSAALS